MKLQMTYRFRIYPNVAQRELIEKNFGAYRFVYNFFLEKWIRAYREGEATPNRFEQYKECQYPGTLLASYLLPHQWHVRKSIPVKIYCPSIQLIMSSSVILLKSCGLSVAKGTPLSPIPDC